MEDRGGHTTGQFDSILGMCLYLISFFNLHLHVKMVEIFTLVFVCLQDEKIECCRFSRDGMKPFLFCTVAKGVLLIEPENCIYSE